MAGYDSSILAKNLTRLLEEHNISQREIARILSVSSSTVSSWCTGVKLPRMNKVQALADYFGVSLSELVEERPSAKIEEYDRLVRAFREGAFSKCDEAQFPELPGLIDGDKIEKVPAYRVQFAFSKLNEEGRAKAAERMEELAEIPKYQRKSDAE